MTKKELIAATFNFSDEELKYVLEHRAKKRRGPIIGYRVTIPGDEYDYGSYCDYLVKHYGKKEAKSRAESCAKQYCSEYKYSSYISPIYKNTPKPKRIS